MPRGGRREGAGRRPLLDPNARFRVGALCERLWRRAIEENLNREIDAATRNVQAEFRLAYRESGEERLDPDDLSDALCLDQGIGDEETPSPLFHVKAKRPRGVLSAIIAKIAKAEGISQRMVETCWKEFRSDCADSAN